MTKHQTIHPVGQDQGLPDQQPNASEDLCRNFDAEVHVPGDISREFLSAALLYAIDHKAEFGLFHEP
ncbi:hypothetical protein M728_005364 (plasmid) [Ensifer sp. WSM1721]|uniref:hypothetical protein n=1 Tax=Ensifer sp. WSM1721 TaxID=1041159 RepID=UPI001FD9EF81|nr:hypothetical protein [Ensifer sp. WSM1721]